MHDGVRFQVTLNLTCPFSEKAAGFGASPLPAAQSLSNVAFWLTNYRQ